MVIVTSGRPVSCLAVALALLYSRTKSNVFALIDYSQQVLRTIRRKLNGCFVSRLFVWLFPRKAILNEAPGRRRREGKCCSDTILVVRYCSSPAPNFTAPHFLPPLRNGEKGIGVKFPRCVPSLLSPFSRRSP